MVIKSMRLAGYLMTRGFVLHSMEKSNDGSNRNVFIFKESDELYNAIKMYKITK